MKIISKNPEYLPLQTRADLREAVKREVRSIRKNDRRLTPTGRALLAALRNQEI